MVAPTGALTVPKDVDFPYWLLMPIHSSGSTGPAFLDPWADGVYHYDVWGVGKRYDQAETALGLALDALVGREADGSMSVAWPTPEATYGPVPDQRNGGEWGPPGYTEDRKLAWCTCEIAVMVKQ